MTALILTGIGLALVAGLIFVSRKWGQNSSESAQKEKDVKELKKDAKVTARPRKRGRDLTDSL